MTHVYLVAIFRVGELKTGRYIMALCRVPYQPENLEIELSAGDMLAWFHALIDRPFGVSVLMSARLWSRKTKQIFK